MKIFLFFILAFQSQYTFSIETDSGHQIRGGVTLMSTLGGIDPPAYGVISQKFTEAGANFDSYGADDFNIPDCGWEITSINVDGSYSNGSGPAESVNVYIMADSGGLPDSTNVSAAAIYAAENLPYTDTGDGDFQIQLPSSLTLSEGKYWLIVQANMHSLAGGHWNWTESSLTPNSGTTLGDESAWFQTSALILDPQNNLANCVNTWGQRVTQCNMTRFPDTNPPADRDLAFSMSGNILTAGVQLSESTIVTNEDGASASYTVVLTAPPSPGATVTVTPMSGDSTEGTVSSALMFTTANWDIPQTVTVTPGASGDGNDGSVMYNITHSVSTTDPTGCYDGVAAGDVSVTNNNIEGISTILVESSTGNSVSEDGGITQLVTIYASGFPSADVTVDLTVTTPSEVSLSSASVVLTAGNGYSATVTLSGVDDNTVDGTQPFSITVDPSVSTDPSFSGVSPFPNTITGNVIDNDFANVTVTPNVSPLQTSENGTTDTIDYVLDAEPTADVTINFNLSDSSEASLSSNSFVFTNANWNTPQTLTVTGVDDDVVDGDINYFISATSSSADSAWNGLSVNAVYAINSDNDTANVELFNTTQPLQTNENASTDTFTYVLSAQPLADVTLNLSSSDVTEGTLSQGSIIFTPANWDTGQTVTVTGVDDALVDGTIAYQINVTTSSVSSSWNALVVAPVQAENADNDVASVTVTPNQNPLQTSEVGGTDTVDYVLDTEPGADVDINLSVTDNTEASLSTTTLTFTAANWNVAQTVTVTGLDDLLLDGTVPFQVNGTTSSGDLAWNNLTVTSVNGENLDNDSAMVIYTSVQATLQTSESGATDSVTFTLSSQPAADVTFNLSIDDPTEASVNPTTLTFTPGNWNVGQKVIVTGVDDGLNDGDSPFNLIVSATQSSDPIWNNIAGYQIQGVNSAIQIISTLNYWGMILLGFALMFFTIRRTKGLNE